MKQFAYKFALFIILFFFVDLVVGNIFSVLFFNVKSGTIFSSVYGIQDSQEDILLIGASEVSHNFVSKQIEDSLGLTCYNLGLDAHNIYYQYALLREILERHTPSIIVTTTDIISEDERSINSLFPFRKKYKKVDEIIFDIAPVEKIKLISNAYVYNSLIIKIVQGLIVPEPSTNGFIPLYGTSPELKLVQADTTTYSSRTLDYFIKFISLATSSGCTVVVVNTPKYVEYSSGKKSMIFEKLVSKYQFVYFDYECDTAYTKHPEYFKDKVHLNNSGAEIFTDNFITDLKKEFRAEGEKASI